jgi:hypothetical protein
MIASDGPIVRFDVLFSAHAGPTHNRKDSEGF